jgi:RNA polymerase sigma-70 factor, ECF subfamily
MSAATTIFKDRVPKSIGPAQARSSMNDEQDLIAQAKNGRAAAIERLVGRYERKVFRLARNITGNYEDAEEVVQNAFVKAFRNLDAFRGDSRFYTWLVRIAVNEALMKIRGHRFREVPMDNTDQMEGDLNLHEPEDWEPNPEERCSQEELHKILETTISELEPGYRTVFQLRHIEGFSTQETARTLNLSLPAVKSRLQRARLQLRNSLALYFRPIKPKESRGWLAERRSELTLRSAATQTKMRLRSLHPNATFS